jgi:two-component system sensor histidine kinase YesM
MYFKRISITFRYVLAFLIILVLPTILICIFINNIYISTLLDNSSQAILQSLNQISAGVNHEVTSISLTVSTICNDDGIMDMVNQWYQTENSSEKFDLSQQIDSKLNYIFNNSGQVETAIFFFKNGGMYNYKNEPIIAENTIKNMDWYLESEKNRGVVTVHGSLKSFTYNSLYQYVISASYSPKTATGRYIDTVYFGFRVDNLDSFYSGVKIAQKGELLIVDDKNQVLASSNNDIIGEEIEGIGFKNNSIPENASILEIDGDRALVTSVIIPKTKWKIVNITKYKELTHGVQNASNTAVTIMAIMGLFYVLFSVIFFRDIIIPIKNMIKKMRNVENGSFDEYVEVKTNDELYELGVSFNRMVRQIKRLITERDLEERQRINAEIEALQSQISPHFLSNTLNAIRLMAMIAKSDNIKNMTDALIKLMQASFARKGKYIHIGEELENLKSYLYIMKVRYGDKFDTIIDIENDIKGYFALGLILQPIVENSILHGISDMGKKGEIIIKGYESEHSIFFEVQDNGVGMTSEQIERLLQEHDFSDSKGFSKIGIRNVNQRIKLNHGTSYGLKIESELGKYTRITIKLPVMPKKEGEIAYV